jgi:putative copper resistance protein D
LLLLLLPPAICLGVVAGLGALPTAVPGLPDPGLLTRWGLPVVRGLRDGSAALTIGLLIMGAALLPAAGSGRRASLQGSRRRAARLAAAFGVVWTACSALMLALTYSDLVGLPLSSALAGVLPFVMDVGLARALATSVVLSLAATCLAALAARVIALRWALAAAVGAVLPLALTGHALSAAHRNLAVGFQAAHLVGVSVWVGGLGALLLLSSGLHSSLPSVVSRYSALAGAAYMVVALSGAETALAQFDEWSGLQSTYGLLVSVKAVAFVGLGAAGWAHRRRTLPRLAQGQRAAFWRLAAGEVVLMAAVLGLAGALAVIPTPTPGS